MGSQTAGHDWATEQQCSSAYKMSVSSLCCVYIKLLITVFHQNKEGINSLLDEEFDNIQNIFLINIKKISTISAN